MMTTRLNQIAERLSSIRSLSELGTIIDAVKKFYDVDHVYYYAISLGLNAPSFRHSHGGGLTQDAGIWRREGRSIGALSYTPEWITHYFESRFDAIDPVMHSASTQFTPVNWADLNWTPRGPRQFFAEAYENGIGNQGYTVPVHGPNGQFAVFTVNKTCNAKTWAHLLAESRGDFILLAHFTHQQALRLAGEEAQQTLRPLSARERDAMRLLADGCSRAQAAETLGISENTFRVYIDSARHKLGALNIPHAIALAAFRGVITPQ
jgi:DNA-binding CsgD family transcriptional regulator